MTDLSAAYGIMWQWAWYSCVAIFILGLIAYKVGKGSRKA